MIIPRRRRIKRGNIIHGKQALRKNEVWSKTAVIISDKDFIEHESFSFCFPDAKLLICLYHALRSFRREVACVKRYLSSAERNRVLEIIQSIAYANSEESYEVNLKLLQNKKLHTIVDYFMENWDSIKEPMGNSL